MNLTVQQI